VHGVVAAAAIGTNLNADGQTRDAHITAPLAAADESDDEEEVAAAEDSELLSPLSGTNDGVGAVERLPCSQH
jgi:hypothetical protein